MEVEPRAVIARLLLEWIAAGHVPGGWCGTAGVTGLARHGL
jgi:hypothetical protein